jgi:hypothetical protein
MKNLVNFVDFKIAKKLKDLGYNKPFFFFYRTDDKVIHHAMVNNPLVYGKNIDDEVIIAPTIPQVIQWLIDEKKLYIFSKWLIDDTIKWGFQIDDLKTGRSTIYESHPKYKSCEEATLAGIEYVFNHLI